MTAQADWLLEKTLGVSLVSPLAVGVGVVGRVVHCPVLHFQLHSSIDPLVATEAMPFFFVQKGRLPVPISNINYIHR
jgi:hypothetical protein